MVANFCDETEICLLLGIWKVLTFWDRMHLVVPFVCIRRYIYIYTHLMDLDESLVFQKTCNNNCFPALFARKNS